MEWTTIICAKDRSRATGHSQVSQHQPLLVQRILPFLVFGVLWSMLVVDLSPNWSANPQYSFGWLVPVLCAYLFLLRWRTRPPAQLAHSAVGRWIFWVAGFALLPTWLIAQANPDWRLIDWLLAGEVVALSLCVVYVVGGKSWLGHFAFSICFIFVAVPWLSGFEKLVIEGLTEAATVVAVAGLNLFHIAAAQHGNIIEVKTGMLGVDEACSGIRSLQATIVVALFFGEVYRSSALRRVLLVFGGALIAFLCNVGRFFVLGAVAAKEGIESIATWHDPLGFAILVLCLLLVWGCARLFCGPPPKLILAKVAPGTAFPLSLALSLGGWLLLTIIGTECWYRAHATREKPQWSVTWPVSERNFSDFQLSKLESDTLAYDEGRAAEWTKGDGSHWMAYFLRWAKGPARSRILARMHRPEICLPAAGYQLRQDRGTITVSTKSLQIPFRALEFEDAGEQVYVFFCLWGDRSEPQEQFRIEKASTRFARLELVLRGERNLGQQVLEIVISGYHTSEEAEAALRRDVETMIQI